VQKIAPYKLYDLESYQQSRFSQPRQSADKTGMSLTEPNNSIAQLRDFVKSRVVENYNNDYKNITKSKKENEIYFQDKESDEKIAGFSYQEVMDKLQGFYEKLDDSLPNNEKTKLLAKIHALEDALEVSANPEKYPDKDKRLNIALNAYYIMNNQEIPEEYIDTVYFI